MTGQTLLGKKRVSHARVPILTASNHAPMGDDKDHRVNSALSTLVNGLLPRRENESDLTAEDRRDQAFDLAKSIIEG